MPPNLTTPSLICPGAVCAPARWLSASFHLLKERVCLHTRQRTEEHSAAVFRCIRMLEAKKGKERSTRGQERLEQDGKWFSSHRGGEDAV